MSSIQLLHDGWIMRKQGGTEWLKATVPGSVYADLMANGQMADPFWKDNENDAFQRMEYDYEYQSHFDVNEAVFAADRILLRAEGLDTLADLMLNGRPIGTCDNMHRTYEFDVKPFLREKDNQLEIVFHSPLQYIRAAYAHCRADGASDATTGFPHLRKAHCMFGWDWGPRLPDAGIWRTLSLVGVTKARLGGVYVTQTHRRDTVDLGFTVEIDALAPDNFVYDIEITAPDGAGLGLVTQFTGSPRSVTVENPRLWWPNGLGEQALYGVKVTLRSGGTVLDVWERRIGLRTLTVEQQADQWGTSFAHKINGIPIFAMGADYIPEDNILSRITPERTRALLTHCVQAHFNSIRIWGGGYYPDDYFYDICDELGLIVWQDFMFACAVYDLNEQFEANIIAEITDNIRRIRHHACLGLWCGNNEMEMFVKQGEWVSAPRQQSDYVKMYEYIIPKLVKQYDPQTFYWPASPSSGGAFDDPNGENRGDVHYWEVWHGLKPFSEYRKYHFRYLSEFGFQSFPSEHTIDTFTDNPADKNIFSYIMEKHQRNNAANGMLVYYLAQTYLYPNRFDLLLYATQLLQADAIRYGVEHFRRHRGRCMGTIYWQLNDCWPVASWASIDYCGRLKALHYKARHFFAPLLLSCEEEGLHTQNTNANAEPYEVAQSVRFNVANDTLQPHNVTVRWELRDRDGKITRRHSDTLTVPPLTATWLDKTELPELNRNEQYVSYSLWENESCISEGTVIFTMPKFFRFEDPRLTVTAEGDEIVVRAESYARYVQVQNADDTLLLSDNFFDMNPGEKRIKVWQGEAEGLSVKSVYDIR